jgi:hypothetical protein
MTLTSNAASFPRRDLGRRLAFVLGLVREPWGFRPVADRKRCAPRGAATDIGRNENPRSWTADAGRLSADAVAVSDRRAAGDEHTSVSCGSSGCSDSNVGARSPAASAAFFATLGFQMNPS